MRSYFLQVILPVGSGELMETWEIISSVSAPKCLASQLPPPRTKDRAAAEMVPRDPPEPWGAAQHQVKGCQSPGMASTDPPLGQTLGKQPKAFPSPCFPHRCCQLGAFRRPCFPQHEFGLFLCDGSLFSGEPKRGIWESRHCLLLADLKNTSQNSLEEAMPGASPAQGGRECRCHLSRPPTSQVPACPAPEEAWSLTNPALATPYGPQPSMCQAVIGGRSWAPNQTSGGYPKFYCVGMVTSRAGRSQC